MWYKVTYTDLGEDKPGSVSGSDAFGSVTLGKLLDLV